MKSKQLINQLCYEYSTKNYNEEKLKTTQEIKKKLNLLEEYRKIEEEIGIELITLFKALKNGAWFINNKKAIYSGSPYLCFAENWNRLLEMQLKVGEIWYSVKDYGKTFALTREELKDE